MKRKYQSWGDFLKSRREERYRSAREFCSRVSVGISYPQYSRYEAGDQLPNLEQALELCRLLEIPVLEGLLEWNRAQIAELPAKREVDALLDQVRGKAVEIPAESKPESRSGLAGLAQASVSLDDVIVFNRSHLKLFSSDPFYRDIFTYINSFAPEWIATDEVAKALSISQEKIEEMTEKLSDLGVILLAGGKCRIIKRNFYFPDDADFFPLRNMNLEHNSGLIMKELTHESLVERRAFRGLVSRQLNQEQVERIIEHLEEVGKKIISLPDTKNSDRIYSLCVLFGERFSRPTHAESVKPGLTRDENHGNVQETLEMHRK